MSRTLLGLALLRWAAAVPVVHGPAGRTLEPGDALAAPPTHAAKPTCSCTADACTVFFTPPPGCDLHYVELSWPSTPDVPFGLLTTNASPATVRGLAPSRTYSLGVRSHPSSEPSIAWGPGWGPSSPRANCTTLAGASSSSTAGSAALATISARGRASRWLRAYRVSEYSFGVDFLGNHNAASSDAMSLYLTSSIRDCAAKAQPLRQNCEPWSTSSLTARWESCQRTLRALAPNGRGGGFSCLSALAGSAPRVTAACGAWSVEDTIAGEGSFSVHWYCGIGWPESTAAQGPIAEYCVEYTPAAEQATAAGGGGDGDDGGGGGDFSDYLSCNSDETDVMGNDPHDPMCMCRGMADRLLAHQTIPTLKRDCFAQGTLPWANSTVCNCTGVSPGSPLPPAASPSLTHIGRSPVYLPYVGASFEPLDTYEASILGGYNYHFPKAGECAEGAPLGAAGCTWRRLPAVRLLRGAELLAAGWDRAFVPDTPTDQAHTRRNMAAFAAAFRALGSSLRPAECGED